MQVYGYVNLIIIDLNIHTVICAHIHIHKTCIIHIHAYMFQFLLSTTQCGRVFFQSKGQKQQQQNATPVHTWFTGNGYVGCSHMETKGPIESVAAACALGIEVFWVILM